MAAALATCDMATVIEGVRSARGWSQGELARAAGYSQSWVSRVVNGQQSLTVDQIQDVARRLGVPLHLLRLGGAPSEEGPAPRGPGRTKGVDLTRRRDFGRAVAAGALLTVGGRPEHAEETAVDESTAPALRTITSGQRRMDATSSARHLLPGAAAHVHLSEQMLMNARGTPFGTDLCAAASEASGFAAWLHTDQGSIDKARTHYRNAVFRARQSRTRLLDVYMLGSLAAFEIDEAGSPELGLALVREAEHLLGRSAHPTARAWLSCTGALAHAGVGDGEAAARAIRRAEQEVDRPGNTDPPWPWVFAFDHTKVAGFRARVGVRLHRPEEARKAFEEAHTQRPASAKQAALLQVELASVHLDSGEVEEAFRLAGDALSTGLRFESRRLVSRVRSFRRAYRGPDARCVDGLDRRLGALVRGPGTG
ncbi:helix-turn-helix transcriptional regulator [Nocardiopsis sp. HNM0947]|uniref:Helix-turn-helix transcriptional regulator n=1 Tax=Nocardiopsis coralli TaxID=2772213 RepID=A0ABR9P1D3_9ACTN|nr:helix-turn-helix transcriptional regulator [Nocardiopsis coralli]MBE2997648.1 helix-turn-helix transcriptional regulator [Nocardiopsis coralli]